MDTETYRGARDLAVETLASFGVRFVVPQAGLFVMVECGDDVRVTADLARRGVRVVPGSPFGAPGQIRVSFAVRDAEIATGCARIGQYLAAVGGDWNRASVTGVLTRPTAQHGISEATVQDPALSLATPDGSFDPYPSHGTRTTPPSPPPHPSVSAIAGASASCLSTPAEGRRIEPTRRGRIAPAQFRRVPLSESSPRPLSRPSSQPVT